MYKPNGSPRLVPDEKCVQSQLVYWWVLVLRSPTSAWNDKQICKLIWKLKIREVIKEMYDKKWLATPEERRNKKKLKK